MGWSQGISITGRIVDSETLEPLPYAHVFIDQTTIGAASDINGEYIIEHVLNGDYKLVFSYVGYELYFKSVSVNGSNLRVSARLIPQKEMLLAVEVKGSKDKEWEGQLKQFTKVFFGENSLARDCKILNPWVLEFTYDKFDKIFRATASAPLQIENKAMGYNIECTLQGFNFDKKGYKIRGLYKFEEINTLDAKEASKWTRNRMQAYQGSLRFLFKSIVDHHEAQNGFHIYADKRPGAYSLNSGFFANEWGKNVFDIDMKNYIIPAGRPGFYKITLEDRLEIHHTTAFANTKTYRDISHPVSWVESEKGYALVSEDGHVINNTHLVTSGELNNNRIAAMLPMNYSPGKMVVVNYITKRKMAKRLQERVYVHTDKGFYYPGEKIWLKAYANYANQSLRDSLSGVLYVDIINPAKEIVQSKLLNINGAIGWGDLTLPDDWLPGIYNLRAYTSWMKNYGQEVFLHSPFALVGKNQKLESKIIPEDEGDFNFVSGKKDFSPMEKIDLGILIDSSNYDFTANCSLSVSPAEQAVFPSAPDIKQVLFFPDDMPQGTLADFIFPLEYGFGIQGRLFRPKKKVTAGQMSVIRGKLDSLYSFKTNTKGLFKIEDLGFYDTTRFSFQAKDKRGRIFGQTELFPRKLPPVNIPVDKKMEDVIDTIILTAPVFARKIQTADILPRDDAPSKLFENSSHSNFDFAITGEELMASAGNQDIVNALQGRIPGFQVNPSTGKVSFRSGGRTSDSEPLFVVDGIPIYTSSSTQVIQQQAQPSQESTRNENTNASPEAIASAITQQAPPVQNQNFNQVASSSSVANLLGHIMVENVSRVEVMSRMDPRYGSIGANGVISIFTRKAQGKSKQVKTFDVFVVDGFLKPNSFSPPDSSQFVFSEHYIPTLLWNPSLSISAKTETEVSFQAPVAPGNYTIVINGISDAGNPLSGAFNFQVIEDSSRNSGIKQKGDR